MEALVLEPDRTLQRRDIDIPETLGANDVRIALHTVGVCGSDVHYYTHGRIGPFVVEAPMVLGHEAAGRVIEIGSGVTTLAVGDRVCMEPGVPQTDSRAALLGMYNLDPAVRFWATPPVHGVLRPEVVHPAAFTFRLPEGVDFAEGAMVEPLAVGMHAAVKARIRPGDLAVVLGAGPIGILTALAALAGGCGRVVITDIHDAKLEIAATLGPITGVNVARDDVGEVVRRLSDGWGADLVFEASGSPAAAEGALDLVCPGGCLVFVGMPGRAIALDVVAAQAKEVRIETVFRYANVFGRALELMASGRIDVKPLITDVYPFGRAVEAFDFARQLPPASVKVQIELG